MKTTKIVHSLVASALLSGLVSPLMAVDRDQQLFEQNCATCHGKDGNPTPVGLTLKARNFVHDPFKQGDSLEAIAKTLETGIPGTGMVSFLYLPEEDRRLLAGYVLKLHAQYKNSTSASSSMVTQAVESVQNAIAPVVDSIKETTIPVIESAQQKTAAMVESTKEAVAPMIESAQENAVAMVESAKAHAAPVVNSVKEQAGHMVEVAKTEVQKVVDMASADANSSAQATSTLSKAAPATDPLIDKGRKLYHSNSCNSCHGNNGQADTPTGIALKARNFVEGNYKTGATIEGILGVMKNGLPGTAMVAFPHLSTGEDGQAIATFLLALKGHPEVGDMPTPEVPAGSGKTSIAFAMSKMAVEERYPYKEIFEDGSAGAKVYAENCASCHGANGQGGIATRFISAAPYYRVKTSPLLGHDGYWLKKEEAFTKLVVDGLPGKMMPGQGTLTRQEMQDLYQFFKASRDKVK